MNTWQNEIILPADSISHFGIRFMKWGQRNYQNEDGTLTPAGKERYLKDFDNRINKLQNKKDTKRIANDYLKIGLKNPIVNNLAKKITKPVEERQKSSKKMNKLLDGSKLNSSEYDKELSSYTKSNAAIQKILSKNIKELGVLKNTEQLRLTADLVSSFHVDTETPYSLVVKYNKYYASPSAGVGNQYIWEEQKK